MDKLKRQLAGVLQYGFWIACAVVTLGTLAVWFLTTSDLDTQNEAQVSSIRQQISAVKQLKSELSDQPNEKSHETMNALITDRKEEVLAAWKSIFDAQTRILTWPKQLKAAYVDEFRYVKDETTGELDRTRLRLPFEKYMPFPEEEKYQVVNAILRNYQYYIKNVLPSIAEIARAEWTAEFESAGGGMGGMGGYGQDGGDDMMMGFDAGRRPKVDISGVEVGPLVKWGSGSQNAVLDDLFPWRGGRMPSTLEVYYSQENIWILKQLLGIVADVNGDAQQPFEAKIREIYKLGIGKSVSFDVGDIAEPGKMAAGGMGGMYGGDMDMDMEMDMGSGEYGDMSGPGGMTAGVEGPDPGDNRYVDTEMKPITGATLRTALTSTQPGDAPLAVAKRIPVMMSVQIDQRYIPELLAACGSAALMVEVKQMRVKPKGAGGAAEMGMGGGGDDMDMGGMGGGGDDMDMGMGGMGMGGMGGGMTTGMPNQAADEYPLDLTCEIYGLIYLYNPPDEEALGIEKINSDNVTADGALPAPSVATPSTVPPAVPATGSPGQPATAPPNAGAPTTGAPAAPSAVPAGPTAIANPITP